ncbi:MAG: YceI family protein [Stenotrophobium sp.]
MRFWMALLCVSLPWAALAGVRPVQAQGSAINFAITQMGVTMQGQFKRFAGTVALDPAHLNEAAINLRVDVASVDAGGDDANGAAVQADWLDAAAHPQAQFVSSAVTALGDGRYQAAGTLTIKGVSRPLRVPFAWRASRDGGAEVSGEFQFQRGDYKLGAGDWSSFDVIANNVSVKFHLVLGAAGPVSSSSQTRSVK